MNRFNIASIVTLGLLVSCAANPAYDSSKAHHTASGFRNICCVDDKGWLDFVKWRWQRFFKEIPTADDAYFETETEHHAFLRSNSEKATLTWIGHATFLIQFCGLNLLTDPHFSERASPVSWAGPRRVVPPAMEISDLPEIDAVIISHDHYDSLDLASVSALASHNRQRPLTFLVPLGMKSWFDGITLGMSQVVELDWAEGHTIHGVTFTAEPSQHWGKRTFFDTFRRLWASWVIEGSGHRLYFAGDTGYANHFKELGQKYGQFDLALLPIGGYEPRWFMKSYHVNPEESVQIHLDLKSKHSVAMHWGTFVLTDEPLDEPPARLAVAVKKYAMDESTFEVYKHGETRFLDPLFAKPED